MYASASNDAVVFEFRDIQGIVSINRMSTARVVNRQDDKILSDRRVPLTAVVH